MPVQSYFCRLHLDMPWIAPDLFTSMAPREMKDRMPFVIETDDGPKWTANNGASFGYKNGVGPPAASTFPASITARRHGPRPAL